MILDTVSRRQVLGAFAAVALTSPERIQAAENNKVPLIAKRVEKAFRAPGKKPNALQFVEDGLDIATSSPIPSQTMRPL